MIIYLYRIQKTLHKSSKFIPKKNQIIPKIVNFITIKQSMKMNNLILFIKLTVKPLTFLLKFLMPMNNHQLISRDVFQKRTMTKSGS